VRAVKSSHFLRKKQMETRKPGRPKKVGEAAPPKPKTKIYKAIGLEKEVYEKLDVIRNRYAVELGFVMSFSQTVAYVTRDLK
jgi:hypothetical protein